MPEATPEPYQPSATACNLARLIERYGAEPVGAYLVPSVEVLDPNRGRAIVYRLYREAR